MCLMRYGLADVRNYDSVELARACDWFAPLYETGPWPGRAGGRSRGSGVLRGRERLRESRVVRRGCERAPRRRQLRTRVERVGSAWVARLDVRRGKYQAQSGSTGWQLVARPGLDHAVDHHTADDDVDRSRNVSTPAGGRRWMVDRRRVEPHRGAFLAVASARREAPGRAAL